MSRILAGVTGLLLLGSISGRAAQSQVNTVRPKNKTLTEAIEFVRPSVVQISARVDQLPTSSGAIQVPSRPLRVLLGTGFIVGTEGYVITARHVVQSLQAAQVEGIKHLLVGLATPNLDNFKTGAGTISIRGSFGLTECDVVAEDSRHDLALLKMKRNPFKGELGTFMQSGGQKLDYLHKAATLSTSRPRDGEAIAVSGYPLNNNVLVTTSGNLASSWAYETEDVQIPGMPAGFRMPDIADSYLADMRVNPGNSGGPVYSVEQGRVIGVCVAFDMAPVIYGDGAHEQVTLGNRTLAYNSGLSVVVPISYVIELLKNHNVRWADSTSTAH